MPPVEKSASDIDPTKLVSYLTPLLAAIRVRKRYVEDEMLRNYAAWQGWPTLSHFIPLPDGSIRYFIPVARRAIERFNSRIVKLLMPQAKWFEVQPLDHSSHKKAESVDALFQYIYQKKIQSKRIISSSVRCLQLYNFAVVHTSPKVYPNNEVWPHHRVVDPFAFYLFPETVQDNSEVSIMFEDSVIPYEIYRAYTNPNNPDVGIAYPLDPNKITAPDWPWHLVERLSYRGLTNPSDWAMGTDDKGNLLQKDFSDRKDDTTTNLGKRATSFVQLTNCHFKLGNSWYKAWFVYNYQEDGEIQPKVVRLDKVENEPLYQWTTQRAIPGELYTNSMMDDIRVLQILRNNAMSQMEANRAVVAEPPVYFNIEDMGQGRTERYRYGPRAIWEGNGKPSDVFGNVDVKDTSTGGLRAVQVYDGLINSSAGNGTVSEGQPGRNMPRAGFAVNSLVNLALTDHQDFADTMEQGILSYMLGDTWHCLIEYTPPSQILKIPGAAGKAAEYFTVADLYGDYTFTWLGTLQFQDQQQRADRFMQMFPILANPDVQAMAAAQGKKINLAGFLETMWADALGERGMSEIIMDMTPEELQMSQQQGQQPQGQPPSAQAASGPPTPPANPNPPPVGSGNNPVTKIGQA